MLDDTEFDALMDLLEVAALIPEDPLDLHPFTPDDPIGEN